MENTKILIVDDEAILRYVLRDFLRSKPGLDVVGEAVNGQDAMIRARELRPDVVLMDVDMPRLNGIDATSQLKHEMPELKVIIVTANELPERRQAAEASGADGFVGKSCVIEELIPSIRNAVSKAARPPFDSAGTPVAPARPGARQTRPAIAVDLQPAAC